MKKKKKQVIDNKQKKKLIITSIFMLLLVVAASFAYYEMNSTESITSVFTSNFGETGGVSLTGPTPNLHIKLTNKDMHYTKEGTSYYATDDNNKNYDTEAVPRTIARLEAVDTNPTYTYYCKFKLAIDVRDSKNNKFKTGDAILHLSGHYEADLDLSNYETPIDIEYFLDQDNSSKEIKAVLEVKNTTNNQNYAEGMELEVDIYNSNFVCDYQKYVSKYEFAYTGNVQEFIVPTTGYYTVELWGASGSTTNGKTPGKGGYVSGKILLNANEKLYVYVGEVGNITSADYNKNTFNGGGYNHSDSTNYGRGGGATDIRIIGGEWNNADGLRSRIIVAGGGGSGGYQNASPYSVTGGNAGGLTSYLNNGQSAGGLIATQTSGYAFGVGGPGLSSQSYISSGSGWYGGRSSTTSPCGQSAGGSSYISGHTGCVAIDSITSNNPKANCNTGTSDVTCSYSPYNYVFVETQMIDGAGYSWTNSKDELIMMPKPSGGFYEIGEGHVGNGHATITYLGINYNSEIVLSLEEGYGVLNGSKKITRRIGEQYGELPVPTRDGMDFEGWYTIEGTKISSADIVNERVQKLYAKYGKDYTYAYTGNSQEFVAPVTGTYRIELWGASGKFENYTADPGLGGYVSGKINLNKNDKLYVYVGESGNIDNTNYNMIAFNGGGYTHGTGSAYGRGGGATDVRLVSGNWDNAEGLKSRIIVAGGGGSGHSSASNIGGAAGGLQSYLGSGGGGGAIATQTSGYSFGTGGPGLGSQAYSGSGGGYFGGASSTTSPCTISAGGSSFISGHNGCVAIESNTSLTPRKGTNNATCTNGTSDTECSKHYSGYVFTDTQMIDGNGYKWINVISSMEAMPNPSGGYYDLGKGHTGNGYARITFIE